MASEKFGGNVGSLCSPSSKCHDPSAMFFVRNLALNFSERKHTKHRFKYYCYFFAVIFSDGAIFLCNLDSREQGGGAIGPITSSKCHGYYDMVL